MDYSEEGSPLFWVPVKYRRTSESSQAEDRSSPPASSPPLSRGHRRMSDNSLSILINTPDDQGCVADGGASPIPYRKPRKRPDEHTQISRTASPTRRRRLSLASGHHSTGEAIHVSDIMSDEPSTSPQREHRSRAQHIKNNDFKNAALPQKARRCSAPGTSVNDEVTSYQVMSPGNTATVTDTRYSSHARAPRHIRHKEIKTTRRHVTTSPPRTRVLVLSKTRASSLSPSPPFDDFTDIPPVELILFEPPNSLAAKVQRPRHTGGPLTTSPLKIPQRVLKQESVHLDMTHSASPSSPATAPQPAMSPADVEEPPGSPAEPAATGRATYLQMWVFCLSAAATLSLPLGMVTLSYLATPSRDLSNLTSGPFATTKSSDTAKTAVHTYQLPIPPTRTTLDPWEGVQGSCQQITKISDDAHLVSPQRSPILPQSRRPNIFCLYNNSRFHRGGVKDFLPQNIPFSHCQNIVYWSFGIVDGVPTSRAESFDNTYGLGKLRKIANSSNIPGIKILLAIGGYREDYAQLSLLGRDSGALTRFVHRTMALMASRGLDGVAIHWVEGEPICQTRLVNDAKTLHAVFSRLRRIFLLNSFSGQLALIPPTGTGDATGLVDSVVDAVDFVFMDTRDLWRNAPLDSRMCIAWSDWVVGLFKKQGLYTGNERKFCMVMSVAPLLVEIASLPHAPKTPQLIKISSFSNYGSAPGRGNAFDMCGTMGACLLADPKIPGPCILIRGSGLVSRHLLFMVNNLETTSAVFKRQAFRNLVDQCMLLVDLDLDNYAVQCPDLLADYFFIRYVHEALNDTAGAYLTDKMSFC